MKKDNLENKSLSDKIKYICSIPIKTEGRILNKIFLLCLISIVVLSIYIYRSLNSLYAYIDASMKNNSNMNIQVFENDHIDYIEHLINNRIYEYEHQKQNALD